MTGRFMNQGDLYDTDLMHEVTSDHEAIVTSMRFQPYSMGGKLTVVKRLADGTNIRLYSINLELDWILNDTMEYNLMEGEAILVYCTDKYTYFSVQGENTPKINIKRCR